MGLQNGPNLHASPSKPEQQRVGKAQRSAKQCLPDPRLSIHMVSALKMKRLRPGREGNRWLHQMCESQKTRVRKPNYGLYGQRGPRAIIPPPAERENSQ